MALVLLVERHDTLLFTLAASNPTLTLDRSRQTHPTLVAYRAPMNPNTETHAGLPDQAPGIDVAVHPVPVHQLRPRPRVTTMRDDRHTQRDRREHLDDVRIAGGVARHDLDLRGHERVLVDKLF